MANAFGNPIILDSTMASSWRNTAGNNAPVNQDISINKILWDGGASGVAGDTIAITYGDGSTGFVAATQGVAKSTMQIDFPSGRRINDFKCTALDHGKLYIYYTP